MSLPDTRRVTSKDGTSIAYTQIGSGAPVILVDGAWCYRDFGPMPKLAPLLAASHTVVYYDRRGRGESGHPAPGPIEREIEDLRALVDAVGGSAALVGLSSGAALALRAAAAGVPTTKLVVYEPPLVVKDAPGKLPPERSGEIRQAIAEDRRSDAVKIFMAMVGVPPLMIPLMRIMPGIWPKMVAIAPTVLNDLALLGDTGASKSLPKELEQAMAAVRAPTLALVGGKSPPYMEHAVRLVASRVPGARFGVVPGQTHNAAPKALAPPILDFLA